MRRGPDKNDMVRRVRFLGSQDVGLIGYRVGSKGEEDGLVMFLLLLALAPIWAGVVISRLYICGNADPQKPNSAKSPDEDGFHAVAGKVAQS